jgi:hypothetical protein
MFLSLIEEPYGVNWEYGGEVKECKREGEREPLQSLISNGA